MYVSINLSRVDLSNRECVLKRGYTKVYDYMYVCILKRILDFILSFCHVRYIIIIPFIMDGPHTDLEATMETYQFHSYGGEQYDRQRWQTC